MIYDYKGMRPKIGQNVFIAPNATIIGSVEIGNNVSIWFNTVIRGDSAPIIIGNNSNIQDNCTIHVDEGKPAVIGENVTVGHNAVIHGCTVEDNCLIGIHATVLSGAHVKKGSIVGGNALVREGQTVGPYQMVTGVPALVKKEFSEDIVAVIQVPADIYVNKIRDFKHLKVIDTDGGR
jgi:carbonic anhydrase/acetyltransferase-like protein (isoleucine patch superfamily)